MTIKVNIILAVDHSGVIGIKDGGMAWASIPEDFANFKKETLGKIVVMGRRTWESLPPKFRPLPGRRANMVLTKGEILESNKDILGLGGTVCVDLENLYMMCKCQQVAEIWVIGGKEIYDLFLKKCPDEDVDKFKLNSIHRTLVNGYRACDKSGVALSQEEIRKFVRMPAMVDPIKGYSELGFVCTNLQTFPWGKIEVFANPRQMA